MTNFATIPNFEELTMQQMFDMAANHIASTRKKSVSDDGSKCQYGGDGCAAAPFLVESRRAEMDTHNVNWFGLTQLALVPEYNYDFVCRLQRCHDNIDDFYLEQFVDAYVMHMQELAEYCGLDSKVLNQFTVQ